jgi:D-cysteine desulfhydrase
VRALFEAHPRLAETLPFVSLCGVPTPVDRWDGLGDALGVEVWAKRDDRTAEPYGGNKVRKLELVLGSALRRGSRTTVTVGYVGSNHAVATAVHASRLGLRPVSLLIRDHPDAATVDKLRAQLAHGAELHLVESAAELRRVTSRVLARVALHDLRPPTFIRAGASSPLGSVGYVAAGYELARQIESGALPEPARIYLPLSTAGTAAGLLLGLRAAGVGSPVHAVRVIDDTVANAKELYKRLAFTLALLRRADPDFPHVKFDAERLYLRDDQFGPGYGRPTDRSAEAETLVAAMQAQVIDGTYSAKALAALIADARAGGIDGPVLFWCTYDGRPLEPLCGSVGVEQLPDPFRDLIGSHPTIPVG